MTPADLEATGALDLGGLEGFFDGYLEGRMRRSQIPGAALVAVRGERVLLARGYGSASLETGRSVNPDRTIFRVASVSKLFTATAVLQLVEQGRLGLDEDVRSYLQHVRLRGFGARPVTLRHLMTHTAGFDERLVGVSTRDRTRIVPLGEYLPRHMPPRVLPPGDVIAYSNHAFALLGRLIELASGLDYAEYMQEHVLGPLGMGASTFAPLIESGEDHAVGYQLFGETLAPVPPEDYTLIAPAGGLLTTGADMARFLSAHLAEGTAGPGSLLKPETLQLMHTRQHTDHPLLPGIGFSFFESQVRGQRSLSHTGGAQGFGSLVFLLPKERLGFALLTNRLDEGVLYDLPRQFLQRFYPDASPFEPVEEPELPGRLVHYLGTYRYNRYARKSLEKLIALQGELRVVLPEHEHLALEYRGGFKSALLQVSKQPRLFQRADRGAEVGFREDERGRVSHLFVSSAGMTQTYERLHAYETLRFQAAVGGIFSLLLLFGTFASLWLAVRSPSPAALFGSLAGIANLAFAAGMGLVLRELARDYWRFGYGLPRSIEALLLIPFASALLTLALGGVLAAAVLNGVFSLNFQGWVALSALAGNLGFLILLNYWNLIGIRG